MPNNAIAASEHLKVSITSNPCLGSPDLEWPLQLYCDACKGGGDVKGMID